MSNEIRLMIDKIKSYHQYLNESLNVNMKTFLSDKKFINSRSKQFLYHGTKTDIANVIPRTDLAIEFYVNGGK